MSFNATGYKLSILNGAFERNFYTLYFAETYSSTTRTVGFWKSNGTTSATSFLGNYTLSSVDKAIGGFYLENYFSVLPGYLYHLRMWEAKPELGYKIFTTSPTETVFISSPEEPTNLTAIRGSTYTNISYTPEHTAKVWPRYTLILKSTTGFPYFNPDSNTFSHSPTVIYNGTANVSTSGGSGMSITSPISTYNTGENSYVYSYENIIKIPNSKIVLEIHESNLYIQKAETYRVWENNGTIQPSVISTYLLPYDGVMMQVVHVSGNGGASGDIFCIMSLNSSGTDRLETIRVWGTNGTIQQKLLSYRSLVHSSFIECYGNITKVSPYLNTYAVVSSNYLEIYSIDNNTGVISAVISSAKITPIVFTTCFPSLCMIDANTVAITFTNGSYTALSIETLNISTSGIISGTGNGPNLYQPFATFNPEISGSLMHVSGDYYVFAGWGWDAGGLNQIAAATYKIHTNGTIIKTEIDSKILKSGSDHFYFGWGYNLAPNKFIVTYNRRGFLGAYNWGFCAFNVSNVGIITPQWYTWEYPMINSPNGPKIPMAYIGSGMYILNGFDDSGAYKTYLMTFKFNTSLVYGKAYVNFTTGTEDEYVTAWTYLYKNGLQVWSGNWSQVYSSGSGLTFSYTANFSWEKNLTKTHFSNGSYIIATKDGSITRSGTLTGVNTVSVNSEKADVFRYTDRMGWRRSQLIKSSNLTADRFIQIYLPNSINVTMFFVDHTGYLKRENYPRVYLYTNTSALPVFSDYMEGDNAIRTAITKGVTYYIFVESDVLPKTAVGTINAYDSGSYYYDVYSTDYSNRWSQILNVTHGWGTGNSTVLWINLLDPTSGVYNTTIKLYNSTGTLKDTKFPVPTGNFNYTKDVLVKASYSAYIYVKYHHSSEWWNNTIQINWYVPPYTPSTSINTSDINSKLTSTLGPAPIATYVILGVAAGVTVFFLIFSIENAGFILIFIAALIGFFKWAKPIIDENTINTTTVIVLIIVGILLYIAVKKAKSRIQEVELELEE
jgi:hypothetical protein